MFKSNDSSYVKMTSTEVIKKCNELINEIKEKRKHKDRFYISQIIKRRRKNIRRFPFLKYFLPSYKTVQKEAKDGLLSIFKYPSKYACGILGSAQQCKAMAKRSQDGFFYMSQDDFSNIFRDEVYI